LSAMSLTQKVPNTVLTIGEHTINVPNQVVARAPINAPNTLEESQMSAPPPSPLLLPPSCFSLCLL
jgi:hypothetical protein